MTTLLKRANGSALDVFIERDTTPTTITLLSPHNQQIRCLTFPSSYWGDVLTSSQVISGPLPLLRQLRISTLERDGQRNQPSVFAAPSPLLFGGAVNLEEFTFESEWTGSLRNFAFPNLTTFKLSTSCAVEFNASVLLDFLEATPTLQAVEVTINGTLLLEDLPREIVVLPNVKTFSLLVDDNDRQDYKLAARLSCPRAEYTSMKQDMFDDHMAHGLEVFPNSDLWKTIVRQYSTSPVEEVILEIDGSDAQSLAISTYSLTFKSSDSAAITLVFELCDSSAEEEELHMSHGEMSLEIFARRFRVTHCCPMSNAFTSRIGAEFSVPIMHYLFQTWLWGSSGPWGPWTS